jgi:hypothetical protein
MARTSKSRGVTPFQMRSGNSGTPYKFLGKIGKAVTGVMGGAVGGLAGKLFGGGGGAQTPGQQTAMDQKIQSMRSGGFGSHAFGPGGATGMLNRSPMAKKDASHMKDASPYKAYKCGPSSPLKRAYLSKGLDTGMYDAISGKGTKKYGDIAKARAFTNISKSIASATANIHANSLRKAKRDWKKDKKFQKWLNRKEKGWKDRSRWGSVT